MISLVLRLFEGRVLFPLESNISFCLYTSLIAVELILLSTRRITTLQRLPGAPNTQTNVIG